MLGLVLVLIPQTIAAQGWKKLAPGMDLQILAKNNGTSGSSEITIVRLDPELWELVFMGVNQTGEASGKTARDWCRSHKLTAAINGGMFAEDYRKHVGYLRVNDHVYNSHVNSYQSVMAFDPKRGKEVPRIPDPGAQESGQPAQFPALQIQLGPG